jgi:hypothetical protein
MATPDFSSLLRYDPETGKLFWLPRGVPKFDNKLAEKEAGCLRKNEYLQINISPKVYLAHRLAWFLSHGNWPVEIDHINGEKTDNRLCNLRDCTTAENRRNMPVRKNKTSQYSGVRRYRNTNRWCVLVNSKYKGLFDDEHEAGAYAKRLYAELGFHPNHGRASRMSS